MRREQQQRLSTHQKNAATFCYHTRHILCLVLAAFLSGPVRTWRAPPQRFLLIS